MNCFCISFFAIKRRSNSDKFASVHCEYCLQCEGWLSYKEYSDFYPKKKFGELDELIRKKSIETSNLFR